MTEPQLPFDPLLPASHPLDEKIMTEFARMYNEYRQADLEASPPFADLCLYVRDKQIGETPLLGVLKDNLKMSPESAAVEATRILNFIEKADAEIWQDLSNGKITVSDARKNSIIKLHAARSAAAEARHAEMTPEEREAARVAALKEAGILTPEERKERRAAIAASEKARIEKLPADLQAQLAADKARAKKLMAEERARLAAKKRRSL